MSRPLGLWVVLAELMRRSEVYSTDGWVQGCLMPELGPIKCESYPCSEERPDSNCPSRKCIPSTTGEDEKVKPPPFNSTTEIW